MVLHDGGSIRGSIPHVGLEPTPGKETGEIPAAFEAAKPARERNPKSAQRNFLPEISRRRMVVSCLGLFKF